MTPMFWLAIMCLGLPIVVTLCFVGAIWFTDWLERGGWVMSITHTQTEGEHDQESQDKVFALNDTLLNLVASFTKETGFVVKVAIEPCLAEDNAAKWHYEADTAIFSMGAEPV